MDGKTTRKGIICLICNLFFVTLHRNFNDKVMYNKVNVMRHQEERTCLNCGKVWTIWIRKDNTSGRTLCFCDKCNKILTPEDKKRIRMEKDEIYKQKVHEQKKNVT